MTQSPETRPSLIARLKVPGDQAAWEEFIQIYRPVVFRIAIGKGMQPADAEDVTQTVMIAVARAVEHWVPDSRKAKFRTWLFRVAQNAIINAVLRKKPDRGSGDSKMLALLAEHACEPGPHSELVRLEYRRESFRVAAREIKHEFHDETWQAFWLTAIEDQPIEEVAKRLRKNTGSVYAARSRVMRRLKKVLMIRPGQKLTDEGDYQQVYKSLERLTNPQNISSRYFGRMDRSIAADYHSFRAGKLQWSGNLMQVAAGWVEFFPFSLDIKLPMVSEIVWQVVWSLLAGDRTDPKVGKEKKENKKQEFRVDGSKLPADFQTAVAPFLGPTGWVLETEQDGWRITGCILKKQE